MASKTAITVWNIRCCHFVSSDSCHLWAFRRYAFTWKRSAKVLLLRIRNFRASSSSSITRRLSSMHSTSYLSERDCFSTSCFSSLIFSASNVNWISCSSRNAFAFDFSSSSLSAGFVVTPLPRSSCRIVFRRLSSSFDALAIALSCCRHFSAYDFTWASASWSFRCKAAFRAFCKITPR